MKPKVIFIASFTSSLLRFRLMLMKEFLARGYTVIAMAPYEVEVAESLTALGIQFISIPLQRNGINPVADLRLLLKLRMIFKKEQPDLVFAYQIKSIIYGSLAAKLARVSRIYSMITGTGYAFANTTVKSRLVGLISRSLYRVSLHFNQLIFFQNIDNLNFFREKKIISSRKSTMLVNGSGVNCEEFVPTYYPPELSFLMIARFLYDKGIREYVEAAKLIKARYPHIRFKLVGWIDTNPSCISQQELDDWIQKGYIEYLGKLADVRPAIAAASVYVLPSYHEGTPRTVLEAMAMARPIITTDAPGCKETVLPHKNGFLVPVKDIKALYQAMEQFILSPALIEKMGQESRNIALYKYDVNKVNYQMLKAMQID